MLFTTIFMADIEKGEKRLAVDFDNSIARAMDHMRMTLDAQVPGGYPSRLYEIEPPDGTAPPEFQIARSAYYKEPSHIADLVPEAGAPADLHIVNNFFGRTDLISARWFNAKFAIIAWCEKTGIAPDIYAYHLRAEGMKDVEAKLSAFVENRMTHAIEDASKVTRAYIAVGGKVFLPDRPWNRDVPESPDVIRCPDPAIPYIARLLIQCGSVANVFDWHREYLEEKTGFQIREAVKTAKLMFFSP